MAGVSDSFKRPRRMLTNIHWKETSGVDHPANELEGWMVMKAVGDQLDAVLKAEAERIDRQEKLHDELKAVDWESAPVDVKAAAQKVIAWMEDEAGETGKQTAKDGAGDTETTEKAESRQKLSALIQALREAVSQVFSRKQKAAEPPLLHKSVALGITTNWGAFCKDLVDIVRSTSSSEAKGIAAQKVLDRFISEVGKVAEADQKIS